MLFFKSVSYEKHTNITNKYRPIYWMHADLNFKLVRIIYTLREKKNVCKHVVESYTIYLKVIIQRDWKGEKYYVSMSGCKSFTFYDKGLDWFKYCLVFFVI